MLKWIQKEERFLRKECNDIYIKEKKIKTIYIGEGRRIVYTLQISWQELLLHCSRQCSHFHQELAHSNPITKPRKEKWNVLEKQVFSVDNDF